MLRVAHVSKSFGATKALDDVGLEVRSGEVHALVGHNGSGKSTLIKALSGYHAPEPRAMAWLGENEVDFSEVSRNNGKVGPQLNFVHQELGLILELSAVDNLAMHSGFRAGRFGRIKWREQRRAVEKILEPFEIALDVNQPLTTATPIERTVVAIAAALQDWDENGGILVLDEPTAVLPPHEVSRLHAIVRRLREQGAGIVYVSHRLDEVFELADRVTVLRGGRHIITTDVREMTTNILVTHMLGTELEPEVPSTAPPNDAPVALEVKNLAGRYVDDVSFSLREGEVLGVAGLPDSGRDELPRLLADEAKVAAGGSVRMPSSSPSWIPIRHFRSPKVVLLPPDRARFGVLAGMTVTENMSLSVLRSLRTGPSLSRRKETSFVQHWTSRLDVVTSSGDAQITELSGGNQQKVLFGRSLAREPKVLLLCEPTAGVDIGARAAIYQLVRDAVDEGLAVLVASSDVGDLQAICTRVIVLDRGRVSGELHRDQITESALVHAMEGFESPESGDAQ